MRKCEFEMKKKELNMMETKVVENMGDDRSRRCKIRCCPRTRRFGSIMRAGTYRTGVGAIIVYGGEAERETT